MKKAHEDKTPYYTLFPNTFIMPGDMCQNLLKAINRSACHSDRHGLDIKSLGISFVIAVVVVVAFLGFLRSCW